MPATKPRIITLTTDFGWSDHYAAVMKGVILGIAPRATIVDITHEIPPYQILDAAYTVSQLVRYFPKGTIHVVVVDPGVGTARRPLLVESRGQFFVGPDNGLFTMIYEDESHRARAITEQRFLLPEVSKTFHGRDVFAPAAAHLASGIPPARFGKRISDAVHSALLKPTQLSRTAWSGAVLKVDRFGNLITNLSVEQFPQLSGGNFELLIGLRRIIGLAETFADCLPGEPSAIIGSSGYLEVVVNEAAAASVLRCASGSPVEIQFY